MALGRRRRLLCAATFAVLFALAAIGYALTQQFEPGYWPIVLLGALAPLLCCMSGLSKTRPIARLRLISEQDNWMRCTGAGEVFLRLLPLTPPPSAPRK